LVLNKFLSQVFSYFDKQGEHLGCAKNSLV